MDRKQLKDLLREDRKRWEEKGRFRLYLMHPEYRLIRKKRLCDYYREKQLWIPIYWSLRILYRGNCRRCGCEIPCHTAIGGGFRIIHPGGIVIHGDAEIGKEVTVLTGTLIGENRTGVPTIADHVSIGAHAILLGGIHVGYNAEIGAGAIVTEDVPENAVVTGNVAVVRRIK